MSNLLEWSTVNGSTLQIGTARITPQCRVFVLRLPLGGFVWNRPTAALVEREGEPRQRLRITDMTFAPQVGAVFAVP